MKTLCTALLLGAALVAAGCSDVTPTGPSLSDVQLTGIATAATAGDRNLCCCRVVGTATNRNSVAVHVTLTFKGYANPQAADPIATLVYFIKDLQPGAAHAIDASGFLVPCSAISNLKTEIEVRGITFPPL